MVEEIGGRRSGWPVKVEKNSGCGLCVGHEWDRLGMAKVVVVVVEFGGRVKTNGDMVVGGGGHGACGW